jgi:hypothetical protein
LYGAEEKLIKINEARGKLITVDRTLGMINGSTPIGDIGFAPVAGNGAGSR